MSYLVVILVVLGIVAFAGFAFRATSRRRPDPDDQRQVLDPERAADEYQERRARR